MHPETHFSAVQVLWTLTFASQLVLLVVLLGRDRARRFPWFTLSILMMALRLLASRLLIGRMPTMTLSVIFIIMADLSAIVGALVILEMGRHAFARLPMRTRLAGALGVLLPALVALAAWGPWPARQTLTADSFLADMRLLQLGAQKLDMLTDMMTIELGILVLLLGRRYRVGWRSHTQRILVGLSTASAAQLAVQAIWQFVAKTAAPKTQVEYEHVLGLRDKLFNANGAVYIAVLIWWIACLWMEEPAAALTTGASDGGSSDDPDTPALAEASID
jgi:hypothetical protein